MVTRVVAKVKSQKSKTNFLMKRKSSKEYSVVFLVEGEKFNLGEKIRRKISGEKFIFALLVLLRTRSAHRLSSQHFAVVWTPNIAELVPFGFFCPQPWFLRRSEHILPGKTPAFSC